MFEIWFFEKYNQLKKNHIWYTVPLVLLRKLPYARLHFVSVSLSDIALHSGKGKHNITSLMLRLQAALWALQMQLPAAAAKRYKLRQIQDTRYKSHTTSRCRLRASVVGEYYWITECSNSILSRCAARKFKSSKQIISPPLGILSLSLSRLLFARKF